MGDGGFVCAAVTTFFGMLIGGAVLLGLSLNDCGASNQYLSPGTGTVVSAEPLSDGTCLLSVRFKYTSDGKTYTLVKTANPKKPCYSTPAWSPGKNIPICTFGTKFRLEGREFGSKCRRSACPKMYLAGILLMALSPGCIVVACLVYAIFYVLYGVGGWCCSGCK